MLGGARVEDLLLAHEHLVVAVVGGDHVGLLRLGRPGDALLLGPAGAALAFLLTEGAEDVLLVDLVVAPWLVLERLVAVDVVLESALERELGRLTEHLDEELFVEVLVLGVRVRLLVDDVAILLRSRALRLRPFLFRLLRLARGSSRAARTWP